MADAMSDAETDTDTGSESSTDGTDLSDSRRRELEGIAESNMMTVMLLGVFISPLGYYWIGKNGLAILNFVTLNYLLLGIIIVPLHCRKLIKDARDELRRAGVDGY